MGTTLVLGTAHRPAPAPATCATGYVTLLYYAEVENCRNSETVRQMIRVCHGLVHAPRGCGWRHWVKRLLRRWPVCLMLRWPICLLRNMLCAACEHYSSFSTLLLNVGLASTLSNASSVLHCTLAEVARAQSGLAARL